MKKESQIVTEKRKEFNDARRELLEKIDKVDDYKEKQRLYKLVRKKFKLRYI